MNHGLETLWIRVSARHSGSVVLYDNHCPQRQCGCDKCWYQVSAFLNPTIPMDTRDPSSIYSLLSTLASQRTSPTSFSWRLLSSSLVLYFTSRGRSGHWDILGKRRGFSGQILQPSGLPSLYDLYKVPRIEKNMRAFQVYFPSPWCQNVIVIRLVPETNSLE